jgi:outer membrane protein assembly factor BamB
LRAFNSATLVEYWNRGTSGAISKSSEPVIANGKVYVSTEDAGVQVWGLARAVDVLPNK